MAANDYALTIRERKRILLDNLFGVDLDAQAVEVTKLSLLLKCLEGENEESIGAQSKLFHERALPDLDRNILCGNSLIGTDIVGTPAWEKMTPEERDRVNPFDYERAFPQVFEVKGGGFDAVIGNPPYVRVQRLEHADIDYIYERYHTPASKTDVSQIFMERSLELLSTRGKVGFISTSQWMTTDYGEKMRAYLSSARKIERVVDFGSLPVFRGISTYPAVFVMSRSRADALTAVKVVDRNQLSLAGIEAAAASPIDFGTLSSQPWNFAEFDLPRHLAAKRAIAWKPLSAYGHAYIGDLTGMDEAFVLTRQEAKDAAIEEDITFPYAYRGEEVVRFRTTECASVVIYPYDEGDDGSPLLIPPDDLKKRFPNTYRYLHKHHDELIERLDTRTKYAAGSQWFRHLRPGSFDYIKPPKLHVKGIDRRLTVGLLGPQTIFNGANCPGFILEGDSVVLSPLLGVLNSRLITYHMRVVCPPKLSGYIRFNATNINEIPVALGSEEETKRLASLVNSMLSLHKRLATELLPQKREQLQREIDATDRQIDALVYQLYGLTDDDIRIVEEATK